jgi:hypothetical protein
MVQLPELRPTSKAPAPPQQSIAPKKEISLPELRPVSKAPTTTTPAKTTTPTRSSGGGSSRAPVSLPSDITGGTSQAQPTQSVSSTPSTMLRKETAPSSQQQYAKETYLSPTTPISKTRAVEEMDTRRTAQSKPIQIKPYTIDQEQANKSVVLNPIGEATRYETTPTTPRYEKGFLEKTFDVGAGGVMDFTVGASRGVGKILYKPGQPFQSQVYKEGKVTLEKPKPLIDIGQGNIFGRDKPLYRDPDVQKTGMVLAIFTLPNVVTVPIMAAGTGKSGGEFLFVKGQRTPEKLAEVGMYGIGTFAPVGRDVLKKGIGEPLGNRILGDMSSYTAKGTKFEPKFFEEGVQTPPQRTLSGMPITKERISYLREPVEENVIFAGKTQRIEINPLRRDIEGLPTGQKKLINDKIFSVDLVTGETKRVSIKGGEPYVKDTTLGLKRELQPTEKLITINPASMEKVYMARKFEAMSYIERPTEQSLLAPKEKATRVGFRTVKQIETPEFKPKEITKTKPFKSTITYERPTKRSIYELKEPDVKMEFDTGVRTRPQTIKYSLKETPKTFIKPKSEISFTPITRFDIGTQSKVSSKAGTSFDLFPISDIKQEPSSKIIPDNIINVKPKDIIIQKPIQEQKQKPIQEQKFSPIGGFPTISGLSTDYADFSPTPSKGLKPFGMPFGIDMFGSGKGKKGGAKFKKKYVASIEAQVFNIRGKKGRKFGEITGLGVRPL